MCVHVKHVQHATPYCDACSYASCSVNCRMPGSTIDGRSMNGSRGMGSVDESDPTDFRARMEALANFKTFMAVRFTAVDTPPCSNPLLPHLMLPVPCCFTPSSLLHGCNGAALAQLCHALAEQLHIGWAHDDICIRARSGLKLILLHACRAWTSSLVCTVWMNSSGVQPMQCEVSSPRWAHM